MEQKKGDRQAKHKRDIKILIALGVVAFVLMVVSLMVVVNTNKEIPKPPTDNTPQVEEEVPLIPGGESQEATDPSGENVGEVPADTTNGESDAAEESSGSEDMKPVETSKSYVSENLHITFEIPSGWKGLVDVHENAEHNIIEFLYKGEFLFLSLRAVSEIEYKEDTGYFDSFYNTALTHKNIMILYSLPNEHPLAHNEGSREFHELNTVMSDNYNLIKTVKAK